MRSPTTATATATATAGRSWRLVMAAAVVLAGLVASRSWMARQQQRVEVAPQMPTATPRPSPVSPPPPPLEKENEEPKWREEDLLPETPPTRSPIPLPRPDEVPASDDESEPERLRDPDHFVDYCLSRVSPRKSRVPHTVIVVYASMSYLEPLFNWLAALQRVDDVYGTSFVSMTAVVCLDTDLHALLRAAGFPCFPLSADVALRREKVAFRFSESESTSTSTTTSTETTGSLSVDQVAKLWIVRVDQLSRLLRRGLNVVLSDTDAVWLRDPFTSIPEAAPGPSQADIVGGRGFFPYNSPWGSALCMGWVFFRSRPPVVSLVERALAFTRAASDDQIGFDQVFHAIEKATGTLAFPPGSVNPRVGSTTSVGTLGVGTKATTLAFAAPDVLPRDCSAIRQWSRVAVAHCHMHDGVPAKTLKEKGNHASHTAVLERFHVYFLPPRWAVRLGELKASRFATGLHDPKVHEAPFRDLLSRLWRDSGGGGAFV